MKVRSLNEISYLNNTGRNSSELLLNITTQSTPTCKIIYPKLYHVKVKGQACKILCRVGFPACSSYIYLVFTQLSRKDFFISCLSWSFLVHACIFRNVYIITDVTFQCKSRFQVCNLPGEVNKGRFQYIATHSRRR